MSLNPDPQSALIRIREIALSLPEAGERESHGQPSFFVEKMFAQFRHGHHGDDHTALCVRVADADEAEMLLETSPDQYRKAAYLGPDWVAIDLGTDPDWILVGDRIARSWELSAPRRLLEAGGR